MAARSKIALSIFGLALALIGCTDSIGDKYVSFAQCLAQKDVVMYGAYWCPHCANQKKLFGQAGFAQVHYVECDPNGENSQTKLCLEKKIDGYPTWLFSDGTRTSGETSLEDLAQKSGCQLSKETK